MNQSFYDFVYPPEKLEIYQEFASHQILPRDEMADHEKGAYLFLKMNLLTIYILKTER